MRVIALTILLTGAMVSVFSLAIQPAVAQKASVTCPCASPDGAKGDRKVKAHAGAGRGASESRHVVRRKARRYAGNHYDYRTAAPVMQQPWDDRWRVAPNDAFIPGPPATYYPPEVGLQIDDRGWTGGVGDRYGADGGGGGYGQLHFGAGGSVENGPTYNSTSQSFQYNPSQAGPFQNRLMGGFAPPPSK